MNRSQEWNQDSIIKFYNDQLDRQLGYYSKGNPRIERAIHHTLSWIPKDVKSIIDIGCGIGWSSWEIKRHFENAYVVGIDFSPRLIAYAKLLFHTEKLDFQVQDILNWDTVSTNQYGVIVLLDVYEHIPMSSLERFHNVMRKLLSPDGTIILTFPSIYNQANLRINRPDLLQPIDENISLPKLLSLSKSVDGQILSYEHVDIWEKFDYVHAIISRKNKFQGIFVNEPTKISLEPINKRRSRIKATISSKRSNPQNIENNNAVVFVLSPNKDTYSETFIKSHIDNLPAKILLLFGGNRPTQIEYQGQLNWFKRIITKLSGIFLRSSSRFLYEIGLKLLIFQFKPIAVLAEYGPSGVELMDIFERLNTPLIVHFHGYDAYSSKVLEKEGKKYPNLFEKSHAIIAVSEHMVHQLEKLGAPKEKIHQLTSSGVDSNIFNGADPKTSDEIFISVGRFVDKKAPVFTLLAFIQASKKLPNSKLIMVGNGPLLDLCKSIAAVYGSIESIHFTDQLEHNDIANLMQKARCYIQHSITTSYGDSEGTPIAILEAGASGLPVISTIHGGIPDIVIEGKTGFLVEEGDIDRMAEKMVLLANDPDLAGKMGNAAREFIIPAYSMEIMIDKLWRIIETAVNN